MKNNRKTTGPTVPEFIPGLDGIRALAIIPVLILHLREDPTTALGAATAYSLTGGFLGVDLFFVLSGFLITNLLLKEQSSTGRINLWAFYMRRSLRLLPALVALLLAYGLYVWLTRPETVSTVPGILSVLFYYCNWHIAHNLLNSGITPQMGHLWSLAVEEQFYILWPITLIAMQHRRLSGRRSLCLLIVLFLSVTIWRLHLFQQGVSWFELYVRTDTRADALLAGAIAAHLYRLRAVPDQLLGPIAALSSAIFAFCVVQVEVRDAWLYQGGFSLLALCAAALILAVAQIPRWGAVLQRSRALNLCGKLSYGLYIWHMLIFYAFNRYASSPNSLLSEVLALSLLAVVTLLSWYCVERPALRLKTRLQLHLQRRPSLVAAPLVESARNAVQEVAQVVEVVTSPQPVELDSRQPTPGRPPE